LKKSYRLNMEALYAAALKSVRVTVRKVTVHLDGSATVKGDAKVEAAIRRIQGVNVLSAGGGEITFTVPNALEHHVANPPRLTEAEKAQLAAEKAQRKAERDAKRANSAQVEDDAAEVEEDDEPSE
jgi:hypothetical protein